jgi:hypothetical protein
VAIVNKDSRVKYDYLLSTMPIDRLVAMSNGVSSAVSEKASCCVTPPRTSSGSDWQGSRRRRYRKNVGCIFLKMTVHSTGYLFSSNYSPYNVPDAGSQWSPDG